MVVRILSLSVAARLLQTRPGKMGDPQARNTIHAIEDRIKETEIQDGRKNEVFRGAR